MAELLERNGNKVKFKVVVPTTEVNKAFTEIMNALSRQVRVPGFRPGKAPKGVVEKRVGADFVQNEVAKHLIEQNYGKAVSELKLVPVAANVNAGDIAEHQDFEFTVDAENYPEVTLPNWESFTIEAAAPSVGDEDLTKALEEIRQGRATYEQVDRAAEAEDMVNVEILEGEDAGKTYPVYLDRAEAGVRNALLGQGVGAEVEVIVAGADAEDEEDQQTLKVKVLDIRAKKVPDLDEEFVKSFKIEGVETVEAFQERVKQDLSVQAEQKGKQDRRDEFVRKLGEGATLEIPQVMIDRRKTAMETDLENDLKNQGITLEAYKQYLEIENKLEEFEKDMLEGARLRVRNDLALEKLTEALEVKLSEEDWSNGLRNYAASYRVSVPNLIKTIGDEGVENLRIMFTRDRALEQAMAKFA
jgi:trigger factor